MPTSARDRAKTSRQVLRGARRRERGSRVFPRGTTMGMEGALGCVLAGCVGLGPGGNPDWLTLEEAARRARAKSIRLIVAGAQTKIVSGLTAGWRIIWEWAHSSARQTCEAICVNVGRLGSVMCLRSGAPLSSSI